MDPRGWRFNIPVFILMFVWKLDLATAVSRAQIFELILEFSQFCFSQTAGICRFGPKFRKHVLEIWIFIVSLIICGVWIWCVSGTYCFPEFGRRLNYPLILLLVSRNSEGVNIIRLFFQVLNLTFTEETFSQVPFRGFVLEEMLAEFFETGKEHLQLVGYS